MKAFNAQKAGSCSFEDKDLDYVIYNFFESKVGT